MASEELSERVDWLRSRLRPYYNHDSALLWEDSDRIELTFDRIFTALQSATPQPAEARGMVEAVHELLSLRIMALGEGPRSARKDFAIQELRFVLGRLPALRANGTEREGQK